MTGQLTLEEEEVLGREKATKHQHLDRIVPGLGGSKSFLFFGPSSCFDEEEDTPRQIGEPLGDTARGTLSLNPQMRQLQAERLF